MSFFSNELAAKRLGLLHELLPQAKVIAQGGMHDISIHCLEFLKRDTREEGRFPPLIIGE